MFNQIIVEGFLGQDPEMRFTPNGTPVTNFSVAVNRRWTTQDGQDGEETVWFRVAAWNGQAEPCNQYLKKGSRVLVKGRMREPSAWINQQGDARSTNEITAEQVIFLDRPNGNGNRPPEPEPSDDDIPF